MNASKQIGFIVFGFGSVGSIFARNLLVDGRTKLRWIVVRNVPKTEKVLEEWNVPGVRVITEADVGEALKDKDVQAVLICSPTRTHEKYVVDSLRAGKKVFCEKPIAPSFEAAATCYKEAAKLNLPLFCAYNRRFDPGHSSVIKDARSGVLGKIRTIISQSRDFRPESFDFLTATTGIINNSCIHDIDMVLQITGEAPCTVYAQGHAFAPEVGEMSDVDSVALTLKFPSGTLAIINVDRSAPFGYDQRLEVLGDKAMMISGNQRPTALEVHDSEGTKLDPCYKSFIQRYAESYKLALNHFIDVVQGKAVVAVSAEECLLSCKVADACALSLKNQQAIRFEK